MVPPARLLFPALLVARLASAAALPPATATPWISVASAHFTLFSNADEARTREIALDLERLRASLARLTDSGTVATPLPTSVFVFATGADMDPYRPVVSGRRMNAVGLFRRAADGNYVVIEARPGDASRSIVFHEYLHFFLGNNFLPQPIWYEEGLAEYYATFEATDREARLGRPIAPHARLLASSALLPLDQLFEVTPESPEYHETSRQGLFYAESWALVHYLTEGNPRRTPQLVRFLSLVTKGAPTRDAFRDAFETEPQKLLLELADYVRAGRFPTHTVRFDERLDVDRTTTVTPLRRSDVLARLGELLAHVDPGRPADARAHLDAALALEPGHARATLGLGFLKLREGKAAEAAELLRQAVALGPADGVAQLLYGEALVKSLEGTTFRIGEIDPPARRTIDAARVALRRATELLGDFAEAHGQIGRTYLLEPKDAIEPGIAELTYAVARLPGRPDLALELATLHDRKGDRASRDEVLRKALGNDGAARVAARMNASAFFREALEKADRLCKERKPEEALPILETLSARASPEYKASLEEQLAIVRTAAARNRDVRRYNDAISLLNAQELEKARDAFAALAASAADASLATDAKGQVERITKFLADRTAASKRRGLIGQGTNR